MRPIISELLGSYSRYQEKLVIVGRFDQGHIAQGLVGEDDVRGDTFFLGQAFALGLEEGKKVLVLLLAGPGGEARLTDLPGCCGDVADGEGLALVEDALSLLRETEDVVSLPVLDQGLLA
jgi:hypothetical protein